MENKIVSLTAQIVSAHVAANDVSTEQLSDLIRGVHQALTMGGQVPFEPIKAEPAVAVKRSLFADHIICLDCGQRFKTLKRHLATDHGMTPDEYRAKWELPPSYPMVTPEYAATRSNVAKDIGLGRRKKVVFPPTKRGRSKKV